VNESTERIGDIVQKVGLSGVQLHGTENAEFARNLFKHFDKKVEILRVLPMSQFPPGEEDEKGFDLVAAGVLNAEDAQTFANLMRDAAVDHGLSEERPGEIRGGPIQRVVLDSGAPGVGGTGKVFNWHDCKLFVEAIRTFTNVIIAGGLTAENVSEAIKLLRPWGVDVASGVESEPGKKDHGKVRAFVKSVREAEKKN
jgi:phosphoribosylanthranilate isomerase